MKIKFFNPANIDKNLKATVHKSGKLGFTVDAANKMDLKSGKSAAIGINEDAPLDNSLYIVVANEQKDGYFKVVKAGAYYYLNLKNLFDMLKIEYKTQSVVYEISEEIAEEQKIFKLSLRENTKKNKPEEIQKE